MRCGQRERRTDPIRHRDPVPVPAVVPDLLRRRPFRGTAAVSDGLLTRPQLRSSPWRRLFRDVYVQSDYPYIRE